MKLGVAIFPTDYNIRPDDFALPICALNTPDLNPDEHVWTQLKALFRRQPLARDEDLGSAVGAAMTVMQEDRRLVQNFFRHPAVAYVKKALPW